MNGPLDRRIVLSGLWTAMAFVCSFTVLFGFFRADVVAGVLEGRVPGEGITIDQAFLTLATAHVLLPILMIGVCLLAPMRVSRIASIAVSAIHLVPIVATVGSESWLYYVILNAVEVAFLLTIAGVAWRWRVQLSPSRE